MNYNKIIIILIIILVAIAIAGIVFLNPMHEKTQSTVTILSNNELNNGDEFSISLTDKNGTPLVNQTVNITFINANGEKTVKQVNTDNAGKGVILLNDLASAQYTVNVTYAGNDNYLNSSSSQQLTIKEKVVQTQTTSSSNDDNYYNGHSRSEFSEGEQAAIDDARAHGYNSPSEYYKATGKTAGQAYLDTHPGGKK